MLELKLMRCSSGNLESGPRSLREAPGAPESRLMGRTLWSPWESPVATTVTLECSARPRLRGWQHMKSLNYHYSTCVVTLGDTGRVVLHVQLLRDLYWLHLFTCMAFTGMATVHSKLHQASKNIITESKIIATSVRPLSAIKEKSRQCTCSER